MLWIKCVTWASNCVRHASAMPPANRATKAKAPRRAETYQHPEADSPMRPEVGTQAQFKKKSPLQTYRYDSSLSPSLEWDGQNPAPEVMDEVFGSENFLSVICFQKRHIFNAGKRILEGSKTWQRQGVFSRLYPNCVTFEIGRAHV